MRSYIQTPLPALLKERSDGLATTVYLIVNPRFTEVDGLLAKATCNFMGREIL